MTERDFGAEMRKAMQDASRVSQEQQLANMAVHSMNLQQRHVESQEAAATALAVIATALSRIADKYCAGGVRLERHSPPLAAVAEALERKAEAERIAPPGHHWHKCEDGTMTLRKDDD